MHDRQPQAAIRLDEGISARRVGNLDAFEVVGQLPRRFEGRRAVIAFGRLLQLPAHLGKAVEPVRSASPFS
jgi:hypothetical protein